MCRCGRVPCVWRFGDGLRLSPHFHTLFVDGVWSKPAEDWPAAFYPFPPPSDDDVAALAALVRRKVLRRLLRLGVVVDGEEAEDAVEDDEPALALCSKASLLNRIAVGEKRGRLVATLMTEPPEPKPHGRRCAIVQGFSIHANTYVAPQARPQLEALCRYITRPAVCDARLDKLPDGRIRMAFKNTWSNGATARVFEPVDFIAKLVPLVVRPRINLLRYHGQFAGNAAWRAEICRAPGSRTTECGVDDETAASDRDPARRRRYSWSELLRRCFAVDVATCRCGGRKEIIALIHAGPTCRKILDHLDLPSNAPRFRPARGPPDLWSAANDDHVEADTDWDSYAA